MYSIWNSSQFQGYFSALKSYYQSSLPYVTCQTLDHNDIIPSVIEANATDVTAQQEWEAEWNQSGLASRLSQQVTWFTVSVIWYKAKQTGYVWFSFTLYLNKC